MKHLVENKFIDAFFKTVLFSAITHVILLFIFALKNNNFELVNIFNILDLELIFANIEKGMTSFVFSYIFITAVFLFFFFSRKRS